MKNLLLLIAATLPVLSWASIQYFPSGLFKSLRVSQSETRLDEGAALGEFFNAYFSEEDAFFDEFEWRQSSRFEDKTHAHLGYELFYRNRRVLDQHLKVHFSQKGFIEYATSSWEYPFHLSYSWTDETRDYKRVAREHRKRFVRNLGLDDGRDLNGQFALAPVVWVSGSEAKYALEVRAFSRAPFINFHRIIDERSDEILEHRRVLRNITNNVYLSHPDNAAFSTTTTLPGVTASSTTLTDDTGYINVKRERATSSTTFDETDVNPNTDYSAVGGFSVITSGTANPGTDYGTNCTTGVSTCPNQDFDAINVYFHLKTFRDQIQSYLSTLGNTANLDLDPLAVRVNTASIDTNGNGTIDDEANNAFYTSGFTGIDSVVKRGLFFLRPSAATASLCGSGTIKFWPLSREALVVVHEYQHYLTDKITGMIAGSLSAPNVGDSLHEGYSDYFGASQVSRVAGTDVTNVGAYAFQGCSAIQRDIAQLKVFTNASASTPAEDFRDSHTGGWSWASGLWSLRTSLGADTADKIALKSLFFLSTKPGFIEAVEALVLADAALNAGANATAIRTVFYDSLKFAGGSSDIFADPATGELNLGFTSCLSTPAAGGGSASGLLWLFWMLATLGVGRWFRS